MADRSDADGGPSGDATVASVTVEKLDLPLAEPFEIALGVQEAATNVLVTVETDDGTRGYGEGSPVAPVTGETQAAAVATARAAGRLLVDEPLAEYRRLVGELRETFPGNPSALLALETAVLDAYCRHRGLALSELFGGPPEPVTTDVTVGIMPPADARERAERAADRGFEHVKVKTGTAVVDDVARVRAVREGAPDASLKVDANQGWTPAETARFADAVADHGVELALIEQPVPAAAVDRLADARRRVDVPVAADEAVFDPADALRVVRAEAADVLNLKLGKGGLLGGAAIVEIARAAGLEVMVGCMLEGAVGTHAGAHLVAGTGAVEYVDLDANRLLADDVVEPESGPVHDIAGPGHGVVPDRG